MVAPLTSDLAKAKISGQEFVHKSPPLGAIVKASSNLFAAERRCKWSYLAKRKNFALQLRFIATPSSQKSTDFCDVL